MMNEIFHFLKFEEFINELGKICFPLGKWNLEHIGNCSHTTEFLPLAKAVLILLPPLSPNVNNANN